MNTRLSEGCKRNKSERNILNIRIIEKPVQKQIQSYPQTSRRDVFNAHYQDEILTCRRSMSNASSLPKLNENDAKCVNIGRRQIQKGNCKQSCTDKQSIQKENSCKQMEYILAMLQKLMKKQVKQNSIIKQMSKIPLQLRQSKQINIRLKQELLEMKELMKSLLLEREQDRMFKFYQDQ